MDSGRYIWCRHCDAIHHVTPFDRSPLYKFTSGQIEERLTDDWRDFMSRHAGHRLEPLTATGKSFAPEGSAFDPMKIVYIQVCKDAEVLLLRRSRSSIEEPFAYKIVTGKLVESEACLHIQKDAIRKEMKLHFCWAPAVPLSDDEIQLFIGLFQDTIQKIDPANLCGSDFYIDDQTSLWQLPAFLAQALMEKCREHFPLGQLGGLRRFVESHSDASDVMALVKRTPITLDLAAE